MSSKINGISPGQIDSSVSRTNTRDRDAQAPGRQSTVSEDATTVELTAGAVRLGELDQVLKALPEVDAERVEAIKSAISRGEYEIDTAKIADAILKFDKEIG